MSKFFLDTEFKEGFHKPWFGKRRHYIDLISIGIVCEDGREYYAISNEFDLNEIWYSEDTWIKENVLKQIHGELCALQTTYAKTYYSNLFVPFTLSSMRTLIKWNGKSNKEIVDDIKSFVGETEPQFYAYFADYDWVLFCSLFGRMIDLPKDWPMYCRDIKQYLDNFIETFWWPESKKYMQGSNPPITFKEAVDRFKALPDYPKNDNSHNALDDAKFNRDLYNFLHLNNATK